VPRTGQRFVRGRVLELLARRKPECWKPLLNRPWFDPDSYAVLCNWGQDSE